MIRLDSIVITDNVSIYFACCSSMFVGGCLIVCLFRFHLLTAANTYNNLPLVA